MTAQPTSQPTSAARAGVLLVCGVALVRVLATFDPFPGWSGDPFAMPAPIVGITPAISLALDAAMLLASALILLRGEPAKTTRAGLVLLIPAAAAIAWHARPDSADGLDNLIIGSAWFSALCGAVALHHACSHESLRTLAAACLYGIIPLLALKGGLQVYIEHPDTVREFAKNRQAFLESQGWAVGSPMAQAYERRLMQTEASGWFGLANVFASLMAAGVITLTGLAWVARPSRATPGAAKGPALVLALMALIAAGGLFLAGAKGGFGAAALGLVVLFVALLNRRSSRIGGVMALGAVACALLAVIARGVVGTRLGELSLLFRWFYMQGAARIFGSHTLTGVGPAGFKDAYMLAKPINSPEDVVSPHSVLLDYAATLGLAGLCLGALWLGLVYCAGKGLFTGSDAPSAPAGESVPARELVRAASLAGMVAILASAWLERPLATPESTMLRLAGIACFALVAWAIVKVWERPGVRIQTPLAAAAIALAAHAQIEMTPITPGAAAWFVLALAVAAPVRSTAVATGGRVSRAAALVPFAACAGLLACVPPVVKWELALRRADGHAAPATELAMRAASVAAGNTRDDSTKELAADLSMALGRAIPASPKAITDAVGEVRARAIEGAKQELELALAAQPRHFGTARAVGRVYLQVAQSTEPKERPALLARAESIAMDAAAKHGGGASAWAWLATTREARGALDSTLADPKGVIDAYIAAAGLAPHEPAYQVKLALAYNALGQREQAREWAARALSTDRNVGLDPLRQLTPAQRDEMKALSQK